MIVATALWGVVGAGGHFNSHASAFMQNPQQSQPANPQKPEQKKPLISPSGRPYRPGEIIPVDPQTGKPMTQQQQQLQSAPAARPDTSLRPVATDRRVVDYEARPGELRRVHIEGEPNAFSLTGSVRFYHNGAVITCDSAVRYNEKRMDCFGNVVVNKGKTYIYGDRAEYDGNVNIARIYAPIIKMVDDDAVMYTYDFSFNTLTNIGRYDGRGTIAQKDNLLESQRGYYYADTREVVCVQWVEIRNDEYQLKSDSVSYNMDTQVAHFYNRAYIWNKNSEILTADRGSYDRAASQYRFFSNGYILTRNQEIWADSIDYNSETENAVLRRNIQMRDEEHKVIGFGDYGLYWGKREEAMLTRNPSGLNFDPKEDTLYMRSDTMFLYTVSRVAGNGVAKIAQESSSNKLIPGAGRSLLPADSTVASAMPGQGKTQKRQPGDTTAGQPHQKPSAETPQERPGNQPHPSSAEKPAGQTGMPYEEQSGSQPPAEKPAEHVRQAADSVSTQKSSVVKQEIPDMGAARVSRSEQRRQEKEARRLEKQAKRTHEIPGKTPATAVAGHQTHNHAEHADSAASAPDSVLTLARADSTLASNRVKADSLIANGKAEKTDSMVRIIRAYRNVKIFRKDMQAVCDSLVAFSIDSTMHLYVDPVMWNGDNQIKSDVIDVFSKNQQVTRALYSGKPIMISRVDSLAYNQVTGKTIEALFRKNEIYRTNVDGNAQTLYYMTEQDSLGHVDMVGFLVATCASITFDIENRDVVKITYKGDPVYSIYPMDKIPDDQQRSLPGFAWETARRPALKDVFDRTIRASVREPYETMFKPTFPITKQIAADRERMIKERIWRDRNDVLSEETLQFIRSLGY